MTDPVTTPSQSAEAAQRPPVVISLSVEGFTGSKSDIYEVPRDEWDAMTPEERTKFAEGCAADHAANYVGWGWHIDDPGDYASTQSGDQPPTPAETAAAQLRDAGWAVFAPGELYLRRVVHEGRVLKVIPVALHNALCTARVATPQGTTPEVLHCHFCGFCYPPLAGERS